MNRTIYRLAALIALIIISTLLARLVIAFWPGPDAQTLLAGIPCLLIILALAAWALYSRFRAGGEIPYFLLRPDFLLPLSIYPAVVLMYILAAPRVAVWYWGTQGEGTVQSLTVEERWDIDYGRTLAYRIDYLFNGPEGLTAHTSYISTDTFNTLQPGDHIPVHYLPFLPRIITAGDSILFKSQAAIMFWGLFIVGFWLIGAWIMSPQHRPPEPQPGPQIPQSAVAFLALYDLDTLLTAEDDPQLWSAVIRSHFPLPWDPDRHTPGLRFALGHFAPQARLKMQPIQVTCFKNGPDGRFQRHDCSPDDQTDAEFDPALAPTTAQIVLYLNKLPRAKRPLASIILPRPSIDSDRLPVYTAVCHTKGHASGRTVYWDSGPDGTWQESKETLNWWSDSA